jgi:hypothetical protein
MKKTLTGLELYNPINQKEGISVRENLGDLLA